MGAYVSASPRMVRGGAIQAWRVSVGVWRRGRHFARAPSRDDVPVAHRGVRDGEFEDSVEHHSAATGSPAIEAEHELVQVAGQVRDIHRALMGPEQPSLGERGEPVHAGQ